MHTIYIQYRENTNTISKFKVQFIRISPVPKYREQNVALIYKLDTIDYTWY